MYIRPFRDSDLPQLIELTIETFRPFYEDYVHPLLGEELFRFQHGNWEQDYREELPSRHDVKAQSFIAVAVKGDAIVGFVSWKIGERPGYGQIYLLAVSDSRRTEGIGSALCDHAIRAMKESGIDAVGIGTGDDDFHASARALYERLGFTKIPVAAYLKMI